jgi:hypothetical protein
MCAKAPTPPTDLFPLLPLQPRRRLDAVEQHKVHVAVVQCLGFTEEDRLNLEGHRTSW